MSAGEADDGLLILCTCPDEDTAGTIAAYLVEHRLAGCVNVVTGVTSVYRWEGEVQTDEEHLLVIKTHRRVYQPLEDAISALHPYDVPEVIALPIAAGLPAYLSWLAGSLKP
jgi:periplasmic divalent cation tolerance protein